MARRGLLIGMAMAGVLAGTVVVTGTSLLPTGLALGPCLRDWTSPSSYGKRASPLATVRVPVGDGTVEVCYGRPSARGRAVFGGIVPYGELWRTGANEPTRLYTNRTISAGGVVLAPGRYSLYSRPDTDRWEIFLNRSTLHWGNDLSPPVLAQEIGHTTVPVEQLTAAVETLTVRSEAISQDAADLVFDWEHTRVRLTLRSAPAE